MTTPWAVYVHELVHLGNGYALWEPNPGNDPEVELADVGYLEDGAFIRLFNASKDCGDVSNSLGVPERYEPLKVGKFKERGPLPQYPEPIQSRSVTSECVNDGLSGT
jgi:hypothetical protein